MSTHTAIDAAPRQQESVLDNHKGDVVVTRSVRDEWVKLVGFALLVVGMVAATQQFPGTVQQVNLGTLFGYQISFGSPFSGLPPLLMAGYIIHDLFNARWIICKEYVIQIEGLFDFNVKSRRMHFIHIQGVDIEHRFYQRFVNVGNIQLAGIAGIETYEIVMRGIANPRAVKDILHQRIEHQLRTTGMPQRIGA